MDGFMFGGNQVPVLTMKTQFWIQLTSSQSCSGDVSLEMVLLFVGNPENCTERSYTEMSEMSGRITPDENQLFLDNNCPLRWCKEVKVWLKKKVLQRNRVQVATLIWVLFENVWACVKQKMQAMKLTSDNLEGKVLRIWDSIPQSYIEKLYSKMSTRVNKCIRLHECATKYFSCFPKYSWLRNNLFFALHQSGQFWNFR